MTDAPRKPDRYTWDELKTWRWGKVDIEEPDAPGIDRLPPREKKRESDDRARRLQ